MTPWGVGQWDVAVAGEKIVAVAAPCALHDEAHRLMDAAGQIVIPGGIEPHAHIASPVPGRTIHDVNGGHHGLETRMGITYTEGVAKRGMPLQQFVEITSTNAARLMGYYPQKGAIAPGSDADMVLIDPQIKKTLSLRDLHMGDYSMWAGWPIAGWPVTTILWGKVMVENGAFYGSPTDGRFIPRKIDPQVLSRPVC